MGRIKIEETLRVLDALAEEFPDRVDPRSQTQSARYTCQGQAACLVAVALERMGFSVDSIKLLDREHQGRPVEFAASQHPIAQRLDRPSRELLDRLQQYQDSGARWGWAIQQGSRRYRRRA